MYPITVEKDGDFHTIKCQCGNTGALNFSKYLKRVLVKDEKGHTKTVLEWELMCNDCDTSIGYDILNEQYKLETSIKNTENDNTDKGVQVADGSQIA